MTKVRQFADYFGDYQGGIDPHLPPYNAEGDAWRGTDGETFGDNRFKVTSYKFSRADIGKLFMCDQGGGERTIAGVPDPIGDPHVCTISGSALTAGSGRSYTFGTDDTAALQRALDHARFTVGALESGAWTRGGFAGEPGTSYDRARGMGRLVVLRSGHKYLVRNTQADWNAGKKSALVLYRRHGLIGMGDGMSLSELVTFPTLRGEVVANVNARQQVSVYSHPSEAYCDHLTVANFSIFGNRKMSAPASDYSGIYFHTSWEGYPDVDPRINVKDIKADNCAMYGIYLSGRMNGLYENLSADQNIVGFAGVALNDTTVIRLNCGGNAKTGVLIDRAHACTFTHLYSYFNGAGGGTVENDSCNLLVKADQARNGFAQFDIVHLQESRGPALVIDNAGYNTFTNMVCRDPGRNNPALNGGVKPTSNPAGLPVNRSGILLKGPGCIENDIQAYIQSQVQVWDTPTYTGTEPLHITDEPKDNFGAVSVMKTNMSLTGRPNMPDVDLVGGAGTSNGKNAGLRVNGAALT